MAKKVIWSSRAQNDRKEILEYWIKRNKSKVYSKKLAELFRQAEILVTNYPEIGKPTDSKNVRIKVVRDYLLIYEIKKNQIFILTIWDSRQNPKKLVKQL
ncbi:type II toxin-antitoxin system RelE/ParE family toxin [Salegentibacter maritimus]|uniref:type II toxin-antitoxin system RelE/ParE family toxin n=1 Tax=Salegentibacter maritimus TaxID=2794347 RepID=UPI0018E44224|nr:type II toxin-antitoxin system RelE/ParE family toxin [Salegentibacter maritimus]MBI6115734.1 type II toxin-antitoxin system RelE/ParE family toxin [Salegentibacter maritimus]